MKKHEKNVLVENEGNLYTLIVCHVDQILVMKPFRLRDHNVLGLKKISKIISFSLYSGNATNKPNVLKKSSIKTVFTFISTIPLNQKNS